MSDDAMPDDDLARLLSDAFDERARSAVPNHARPPMPRFADESRSSASRAGLRFRRLLPVAVAAVVVIAVAVGVSIGRPDEHRPSASSNTAPATVGSNSPTTSPGSSTSALPAGAKPVHIMMLNSDGSVYGVGMPVIAFFSRKVTDGAALQKATTVTVNGKTAHGAWYFEPSAAHKGYPYEAHFRLRTYWPAHSTIHLGMPTKGLSGGGNFAYDDNVSLDFRTAAAHVSTVNDVTHTMTVTDDGKTWGTFPVSLGSADTPTSRGTKIIMEKGLDISMTGPGYYDPHVQYTQRLTYGGEYLHSAPWNTSNIQNGVDSSNGCTNLLPADAIKLYRFLRIGDVVKYPDASGPAMTLGAGYGDWNVPWSTWLTGGVVRTR